MALDLEIRAELRRDPGINERGDPIPRTVARPAAIVSAAEARRDDVLNRRVGWDTLVLCAEAAAQNHEWHDTARILGVFFDKAPPRNQWFIRALLVQALLEAHHIGDPDDSRSAPAAASASAASSHSAPSADASKMYGQDAARQRRKALAYVMEAMEEALKPENRPGYDFLVYNASVIHWRIVRGFLKDGARTLAIPTLERTVAALATVDDADIGWRSRNELALAQAHDEAGAADKAAAHMTQALQLASKAQLPDAPQIVEEAQRAAVHVARLGGPASKLADSARAESKSAPTPRASQYVELQAMLSAPPGSLSAEDGALRGRGCFVFCVCVFVGRCWRCWCGWCGMCCIPPPVFLLLLLLPSSFFLLPSSFFHSSRPSPCCMYLDMLFNVFLLPPPPLPQSKPSSCSCWPKKTPSARAGTTKRCWRSPAAT